MCFTSPRAVGFWVSVIGVFALFSGFFEFLLSSNSRHLGMLIPLGIFSLSQIVLVWLILFEERYPHELLKRISWLSISVGVQCILYIGLIVYGTTDDSQSTKGTMDFTGIFSIILGAFFGVTKVFLLIYLVLTRVMGLKEISPEKRIKLINHCCCCSGEEKTDDEDSTPLSHVEK